MRFVAFNRWLAIIGGSGHVIGRITRTPDLIVYEMPHLRGGAAATVLAGFQTRVEEFCALEDIDHAAVHSATLKKFTTGSGRGDKAAMLRAAAQRGWCNVGERSFEDDNEVDAICLLHYALTELVPTARPR